MRSIVFRVLAFGLVAGLGLFSLAVPQARAERAVQQPTVAIATVTGTPTGPSVRVNADQTTINVRSGPGTEYPQIGVLVANQVVPAIGRSEGGLWIQILYPGVAEGVGWVYAPYVTFVQAAELPIVEPPPRPGPLVTPTIDPTLAAQFVLDVPATRLPTYTPPPPLVIPTYTVEFGVGGIGAFPWGLLIAVFGIIGISGGLVSLLRGR